MNSSIQLYKFPYGKFKGKLLKDIPEGYLRWLYKNLEKEKLPKEVKEYCEKKLKISSKETSSLEKWILENKAYTNTIKTLGAKIIKDLKYNKLCHMN